MVVVQRADEHSATLGAKSQATVVDAAKEAAKQEQEPVAAKGTLEKHGAVVVAVPRDAAVQEPAKVDRHDGVGVEERDEEAGSVSVSSLDSGLAIDSESSFSGSDGWNSGSDSSSGSGSDSGSESGSGSGWRAVSPPLTPSATPKATTTATPRASHSTSHSTSGGRHSPREIEALRKWKAEQSAKVRSWRVY